MKVIVSGDKLDDAKSQNVRVLDEEVWVEYPNMQGIVRLPKGDYRIDYLSGINDIAESYSQIEIFKES